MTWIFSMVAVLCSFDAPVGGDTMSEPLSDSVALALYDAVWPGRAASDDDKHLADCIRVALAEPTLTGACDEWQPEDDSEVNRLRELRRLAGIDDDAGLVERMADVIRSAYCAGYVGPWCDVVESGKKGWRDAARAALAVVREEEGI